MAVVKINGDIVGNDDKWIYDWFGVAATCPKDVTSAIETAKAGEKIEVLINSGGGDVLAGQEIYTTLLGKDNVTIKIQSLAGSAAGVVAMAGKSQISPVAMLMIHNVSMYGASGDYHDMQKNAEILKQMNTALAGAFTHKTGKSEEEILKIMDKETWLTANQCVEYGFVDEIMGQQTPQFVNSYSGMWLTDELRQKAVEEKKELENKEAEKKALLEDLDLYGI
nr:head maturation protease, ClpP-related [uncultured Blautia sp.]